MAETVTRFRRRQKVRSVKELPGVPVGTAGLVLLESGITWYRYFVQFANGVELGSVDAGALEPAKR
jgi:hypothetical protein